MNNIIHYHIQKQKKIRLKPRINLNHNIPNNKSHMQVYQTDSITALVPFLSMRKGRLEFQFCFLWSSAPSLFPRFQERQWLRNYYSLKCNWKYRKRKICWITTHHFSNVFGTEGNFWSPICYFSRSFFNLLKEKKIQANEQLRYDFHSYSV